MKVKKINKVDKMIFNNLKSCNKVKIIKIWFKKIVEVLLNK